MPRYIDADTVVKMLDEIQPFAGNKATNAAINLCKDIVRNAPTVSTDEVRGEGKWIMSEKFKGYAMCSRCEDAYVDPEWIYKDGKWNYCPNCGARMMEVTSDA